MRCKLSAVVLVMVFGFLLAGCGESIEQVSGSPYSGPADGEQLPEGEEPLPPLGGIPDPGMNHLVTDGDVAFSTLSSEGPYNGPSEAFIEPPVIVRGILRRNSSNNALTVAIIHRYGENMDKLEIAVSGGDQNVTNGTYRQRRTRSGQSAGAQFISGVAVDPDKLWTYDVRDGDSEVTISNFEISPSGGSADIDYKFSGLCSPNDVVPGSNPGNLAAGKVNFVGRVHVIFGPEQSPR